MATKAYRRPPGHAPTHGSALDTFRELRAAAVMITEMDFAEPSEAAYYAASNYIVERCDLLVAVWDGRLAVGLGGTGHAVARANELGRDVMITWPQGVQR